MLLPTFVVAFVLCSISPDFFSFSFLHIVYPLTCVFTTVYVSILSKTVSLVIAEIADIDVPFGMPKSSVPTSFVVSPLSFINSSIIPFLNSVALSYFKLGWLVRRISIFIRHYLHLTLVLASVWEVVVINEYKVCVIG